MGDGTVQNPWCGSDIKTLEEGFFLKDAPKGFTTEVADQEKLEPAVGGLDHYKAHCNVLVGEDSDGTKRFYPLGADSSLLKNSNIHLRNPTAKEWKNIIYTSKAFGYSEKNKDTGQDTFQNLGIVQFEGGIYVYQSHDALSRIFTPATGNGFTQVFSDLTPSEAVRIADKIPAGNFLFSEPDAKKDYRRQMYLPTGTFNPNMLPHAENLDDWLVADGGFSADGCDDVHRWGILPTLQNAFKDSSDRACSLHESLEYYIKPMKDVRTQMFWTIAMQVGGLLLGTLGSVYAFNDNFRKAAHSKIGKKALWLGNIVRKAMGKPVKIDSQEVDFISDMKKQYEEKGTEKAVGRDSDYEKLRDFFNSRIRRVLTITVEGGEGKTYFMEQGLAHELYGGRFTKDGLNPQNTEMLSFSLVKLSGHKDNKYVGQLTSRFNEFVEKVDGLVAQGKKVVVTIDEIHMLKGLGATEGNQGGGLENTLKAVITRWEKNPNIYLLAATTTREYADMIKGPDGKPDATLTRRFQENPLRKLSHDEKLGILINNAKKSTASGIVIDPAASERALNLSSHKDPRITMEGLDLAVQIQTWAEGKAQTRLNDGGDGRVTVDTINEVIAGKFNIPISEVSAWASSTATQPTSSLTPLQESVKKIFDQLPQEWIEETAKHLEAGYRASGIDITIDRATFSEKIAAIYTSKLDPWAPPPTELDQKIFDMSVQQFFIEEAKRHETTHASLSNMGSLFSIPQRTEQLESLLTELQLTRESNIYDYIIKLRENGRHPKLLKKLMETIESDWFQTYDELEQEKLVRGLAELYADSKNNKTVLKWESAERAFRMEAATSRVESAQRTAEVEHARVKLEESRAREREQRERTKEVL